MILANKVVSFNLRCSCLFPNLEQRNSYGDLGKIGCFISTLSYTEIVDICTMYIVYVLYGLTIKEMEEGTERGVLDSVLFDEFLRKTNSLASISG